MALPNDVTIVFGNPKPGKDWTEELFAPLGFPGLGKRKDGWWFMFPMEPGERSLHNDDAISWYGLDPEYDDGGGAAIAGLKYGACPTAKGTKA